ncbi:MAG: polyribonucleotide nucleotidyltransferase [Actinobacteria bacterium]|nr:polyribonucleotide nucleotidyltransferase [Actinomycetota bacterium]MCG2819160.1 polyribonucleotide nucleotidyltransferase [Actinomycetes bacterium]MBU4219029.1 polyribonucleotide nucleotidyltransferase [Actinomycetota bacterium]MBU4359217.1 polyribonucleotide nucleotidyltransferase [Actinomycetota bacterium]MBU4391532.1 polyribonucleotide nucleotidyltransferase [Actinomycetota bacterium]
MRILITEMEIDGKKIKLETGKMAKQADGAVVVSCEGTSVLVTAVVSDDVRPIDFLPLTVDVEEKLYAAGKIPGSFFKREGRPTETATLTCRLIDRTIRPNFDKRFRNETQVVLTVLSADLENPPDMLGMIGVAAALEISNIPFQGPVAGVRVGRVDDRWVIDPTYEQIKLSSLNMVVAGNKEAILMVEAGAMEIPESQIVEALSVGHEAIKKIIGKIEELDVEVRRQSGEKPKSELIDGITAGLEEKYGRVASNLIESYKSGDEAAIDKGREAFEKVAAEAAVEFDDSYRKVVLVLTRAVGERVLSDMLEIEIVPEVRDEMKQAIRKASDPELSKYQASLIRKDARKSLAVPFSERFPGQERRIKEIMQGVERKLLRELILDEELRPDGRKPFQIRKLTCEVGLLSKTHGSALFTRGQTQVLSIATLGAYGEKQILDDLGTEDYKSFLHHYNFPPFSSGEARPMRGPKRREIGHGALVERALLPLIPDAEEFPYTIRLVSEVLESNGSTSMASLCASSMALMDAGVPLKNKSSVGGIAMGLILEGDRSAILSDIQGLEDAIGDMDFKVAGTSAGVTALQMDIKCLGLSPRIMEAALEQARQGRSFIVKAMTEAISEPRREVSPNAPSMVQIKIPVKKIGEVIGPGGKNIRGMIERYEVDIDVEDDGRVFVFGRNRENVEKARRDIELITKDPEVGERFKGKVVKIMNFGAFVQLVPGKDGLIHISKLSKGRVDRVEDVVNVGDIVEVEIEAIDNMGRINLRAIDLNPDVN